MQKFLLRVRQFENDVPSQNPRDLETRKGKERVSEAALLLQFQKKGTLGRKNIEK